jgi:hypothetical protein
MRSVRTAVFAAFVITSAGSWVVASPLASSAKAGCPSGYELRTVESLAATGNEPQPSLIDAAGNNDGLVCALPLPDAICAAMGFDPCPVETVYLFTDNKLK